MTEEILRKSGIIKIELPADYQVGTVVHPKKLHGIKFKVVAKEGSKEGKGSVYYLKTEESRERMLFKMGFETQVFNLYEDAYRKFPVEDTNEDSEERREMIDDGLTKLINQNILPADDPNNNGSLV